MGEGRLQCVLLAAATLLMLRAALCAVLSARNVAQTAAMAQADAVNCSSVGACAPWCSWQPVATAVVAAAMMLALNIALQAMGLIDRAGKDPHDKTQPSADLLVGPDAAWQQALFMCFTLGPLVCCWLLFSRLAAWCGRTDIAVSVVVGGKVQRPSAVLGVLLRLVKWLCAVQHLSLCVFWAAQLTGSNHLTVPSAAKLAWAQTLQHVCVGDGLNEGCALLYAYIKGLLKVASLQQVLDAVLGIPAVDNVLQLPLRLLLPRVVYACALAAFCGSLAAGLIHAVFSKCFGMGGDKGVDHGGKHATASRSGTGCQVFVWLCAALCACLVMVLGYKGPATMLAALLQAGCWCILLRVHSAARRSLYCSNTSGQPKDRLKFSGGVAVSTDPSADLRGVVGAGAWGMMSLQLFFCSSHFCEFSGLQYTSAFIGFDTMVWYTSGSLLLLNTCGFLLLGIVSLPVLLAVCMLQHDDKGQSALTAPVWQEQLECAMLVVNSMRFAALVVSMISAAVQQQHILLWAIFAPKLVFELWFMAVTDMGQLLASLLTELLLRG